MKTTNKGATKGGVGAKVLCNGLEGTIVEVCEGQLAGMVVVRLPGGKACVDLGDVRWL